MLALELDAVTKRYGSRRALDAVCVSLPRGSALGLLGPNGAGKSTVLRLALGLARPSAGHVRLRGLDPGDPVARTGVGYLPERLALPGRMSVRAFVRLHGRLAGWRGLELTRQVEAVCERTGIADRADDRMAGLSKGLAQRVGFAQALFGDPELLLLDEPTSGLDPLGVRDAREWIRAARSRGCSVLVSSHVLSEVERTCDRVVILDRGRIAASGRLEDVVRRGERLEDAFVRWVRG
ncbi:MAG: ABC transporter ATP-binding protein [Deltaproteobacteria bacterium]|nr:MAG: ABC transporter ATP-binding protein [Deltaproteobacteria bacterium]